MKKTSKKFIAVILSIYTLFVIVGIFIGINFYQNLQAEALLEKEFDEIEYLIENEGLDSYIVDSKLKNYVTTNGYLGVEMAIKSYLQDLIDQCRDLTDIYNDYDLYEVLYLNNFDADAPLFEYSKNVLSTNRDKLVVIQDELTNLFNKDTIMTYGEDYNLNWYYLTYYKNLMIDDSLIQDNQEEINTSINYILNMFDAYMAYFTFLSDNHEYWTMDDEYIYFETDELLAEYNRLLSIINNMDFSTDFENYI